MQQTSQLLECNINGVPNAQSVSIIAKVLKKHQKNGWSKCTLSSCSIIDWNGAALMFACRFMLESHGARRQATSPHIHLYGWGWTSTQTQRTRMMCENRTPVDVRAQRGANITMYATIFSSRYFIPRWPLCQLSRGGSGMESKLVFLIVMDDVVFNDCLPVTRRFTARILCQDGVTLPSSSWRRSDLVQHFWLFSVTHTVRFM